MQTVFDVDIPDFSGDGKMKVKLRRPSLLALAASGAVPNELLGCARTLFSEGGSSIPLDELGRLLLLFAEHSLAEPSFEEIGAHLTDEQLSAIYSFAQSGVRALIPFRQGEKYADAADNVSELRQNAR